MPQVLLQGHHRNPVDSHRHPTAALRCIQELRSRKDPPCQEDLRLPVQRYQNKNPCNDRACCQWCLCHQLIHTRASWGIFYGDLILSLPSLRALLNNVQRECATIMLVLFRRAMEYVLYAAI